MYHFLPKYMYKFWLEPQDFKVQMYLLYPEITVEQMY